MNILSIIDVYLNSPAYKAGLVGGKVDYILGTREISFKSLDDFSKYIEININRSVILHVYSTVDERVREVELVPGEWGGQGVFGCDVSFGFFN